MSQLFLSKDEKKDLQLIQQRRTNLSLQDQILVGQWNGLVSEFCKRNSKDVKDAKEINLETGTVVFDEGQKLPEQKLSGKKKK
ncbi:MAG: hypothetical protein AB1633_00210 [Elusimicrobiota bacterium]